MKRTASLLSVAALVLVTGCHPNPSGEEVVDKFAPAVCAKAQQCGGAQFDVAYPGGIDDCTAHTKSTVAQQYGGDLSKTSVCSDDEVDSCVNSLQNEACPTDGSVLPASPCDC